ncbi:hypothetical protein OIU76_023284, partial [Salix suchowensis]
MFWVGAAVYREATGQATLKRTHPRTKVVAL